MRILSAAQIAVISAVIGEEHPVGEISEKQIRKFQAIHESSDKLVVDGIPGLRTQAVIQKYDKNCTPLPKGRAEIQRVYGKFSYKDAEEGRIIVDPAWIAKNIVTITLHTGKRVRLHKLVAAEFSAIFREACESSGYIPESVQTFVTRHIGWDIANGISLHSYGIAIDIDPLKNQMGGFSDKKSGKRSLLRTVNNKINGPAFVAVFKKHGYVWGGDWKMRDDMHFQRAA